MKVYHSSRFIPIVGLIILLLNPAYGQTPACSLLIPASEGNIDGRSNASGIQPGDTICLLPGQKSYLWITHLHGSPEAPVVIINTIGFVSITQFYYGIKIDSCSYIKLSGKGVGTFPYGINVHNVDGAGMSIEGLSTDIEVEGIEISSTLYPGIFCKSDPDCEFTSTRDKYTMRNVSLHNNYIHDTGMEGFYIGSSFYEGKEINCDGKDTLLLPHLIRGLNVYNNRFARTGWDGLQVSSADSACAIYGNHISYDSESAELNQMSGIIMGEGSVCDCYNNEIVDGKGNGIQVLGLGGNNVYNNLIYNAGRTYLQEYPYMNGIYVGNQNTTPGAGFLIAYNTIVSPRDHGIDFRSMTTSGNQFVNNIVMNYGRGVSIGNNISLINNYTLPTLDQTQFVNFTEGNFDLKPTAVAVNTAVSVPQLNLVYDILDRNRPFALLNDIGAYECHDPSLLAIPEFIVDPAISFAIERDYRTDILIIRFTVSSREFVQIGLYDMTGHLCERVVEDRFNPGEYQQMVDIGHLAEGIYIFRMVAGNKYISRKVSLSQ
ncbi:MAG: right-handed parallel beta-helix repeat-containing protein [Bacteroidales bacterium]|nr:right-handed parallel beta-helix repeat-containing protein [Bacteroidales bacterium]